MACCVAANLPTMCPLWLVFVVGGWCWTLKDTAVRPHCLALCCGVWGSEAAAAAADGGTLLAWLCRLKSRYNTLEFICAFYFWSIIIFHFKWLQTMTLHKDTNNSQHQHQMKDTTGSGGCGLLGVGDDGAGIALIVWIVCSAQAENSSLPRPPSAFCDICSASKGGCNVWLLISSHSLPRTLSSTALCECTAI